MTMSEQKLTVEQFIQDRRAAGLEIDVETCEIGCWYALDFDPYGIGADGADPYAEMGGSSRNFFVQSQESNGWVGECDLPEASAKALYARIEREYAERERRRASAEGVPAAPK
jgi:hypothetical protein